MSVPTVLITGSAGYIGSVLTGELLSAGMKVIGVDNFHYRNFNTILPYLGHPNYEFHRLCVHYSDDMVLPLVKRADVIIPLAALVGAPICEKEPELALNVNERAIRWLTMVASKSQRIIYPNTNSGYGQTDGTREVTEEDPLTPISVYGLTKCNGERAVLDHGGVSFRLATVFGPSPRMRLDLMVNSFTVWLAEIHDQRRAMEWDDDVRKNPPTFSIFEPHFKRNFVHVRDVCRAFRFAINRPTMRGVYNLGLPEANLTKWELAMKVCEVLDIDKAAVVEGNGKDPDQRNYLVSNTKILNTGFVFNHGLEQGIKDVASIYTYFPSAERERMGNV